MAQEDNSVSYLMALKQAAGADAGSAPDPAFPGADPATIPPGSQRFTGPEKRRSPRYKCEGSAEMRQEGVETRTWATFSDVSLHGCYVEAMATYPAGARLHIRLEANGFKVDVTGNVRVSYPQLGMGIAFSEISDEDRSRLRELLRSISRPSVILGSRAQSIAPVLRQSGSLSPITNPEAAIQAVIQFFDERQLLSREEFSRRLRKSQTP